MWLHVIKNVFFEVNGLAVNEVITPLELLEAAAELDNPVFWPF